jgi:hypothetical protein
VLSRILEYLGTPLPPCEGHGGCPNKVLWETPSQTQYEWDGQGRDPNAALLLCPECSEEYTGTMNDQWSEYHAGLL